MGKLVLLFADGTTQDVPLGKERMMIGRRADNDICLPFPAVSGEHASVVTILADSFLEDLGSTNGTLVNGKPIVKHFLRDHDQIDIGRQRIVFVADDNAHVDPLPVEVTPDRLLGLGARVESASPVPRSVPPPAGNRRAAAAIPPSLVVPDLHDQAVPGLLEEGEHRPDAAPAGPLSPEQPPATTRRESDRRLAAWAAEWAAPAGNTGAGTIDTSAEMIDAMRDDAEAGTTAAEKVGSAEHAVPPEATVRVLSGPSLGREVPINKDELSMGRVGVQVALVRKEGNGYRLVPVEGAHPPRVNGAPVAPEGTMLRPGDTFEVAGVRLELSTTT